MVDSVILAWKNEDVFREAARDQRYFSPTFIARAFLDVLECDSPDEFFEVARRLKENECGKDFAAQNSNAVLKFSFIQACVGNIKEHRTSRRIQSRV